MGLYFRKDPTTAMATATIRIPSTPGETQSGSVSME
jgi:hypothetical protein